MLAIEAQAFESGGFGAGCGGGIGANYGGSSFGCSGNYGTSYTYGGWTNGGGATGFGGWSTMGRGYVGWASPNSLGMPASQYARAESRPAANPARTNAEHTDNHVLLTVNVPADAKVFINDQPTKGTGKLRYFGSNDLQPDTIYPYRVRVEFVADGKPASEERIVPLSSGLKVAVDFGASARMPVADIAATDER